MNSCYNQNYTKKQIKFILDKIKDCVMNKKFVISKNNHRQENIDFINEYNIRSDKQVSILLQIGVEDFCYSLQNNKIGYEQEILYVFVCQVKLFNVDDKEEIVDVYIKFNVIEKLNGSYAVVISFHKRNKPVTYLFR